MTQEIHFYSDNTNEYYDMELDLLNKLYEDGALDDLESPDDTNIPDQTPEVQHGDCE